MDIATCCLRTLVTLKYQWISTWIPEQKGQSLLFFLESSPLFFRKDYHLSPQVDIIHKKNTHPISSDHFKEIIPTSELTPFLEREFNLPVNDEKRKRISTKKLVKPFHLTEEEKKSLTKL